MFETSCSADCVLYFMVVSKKAIRTDKMKVFGIVHSIFITGHINDPTADKYFSF